MKGAGGTSSQGVEEEGTATAPTTPVELVITDGNSLRPGVLGGFALVAWPNVAAKSGRASRGEECGGT